MHLNRLVSALSALVLVSSSLGAAAATKWEEEYAQAIAAYQQKDFAKSSDLFWKSITDGNGKASAWFYLAHSKAGEGKLKEAREGYMQVVNIYKNTPEAAAAAEYVKRLDAHTWNPGPPGGAAKSAAAPVASAPGSSFRSRIEIIQPRDGHPAVSASTIAVIRGAINSLPTNLYQILDKNGAKIFIGPNIIDKWPESLNDAKPGSPGETLAEEPGRTYGRDIYVYERKVLMKGSRALGDVYPPESIKAEFLYQVGHALDDCLGGFSKDPSLRIQYKMDCDSVGDDVREALAFYTQGGDAGASEACAASVMTLLGGKKRNSETVNRVFRRTQAWVKAKLSI